MNVGNKEKDSRLKELFINGINDDIMTEVIRELTAIKKTNEIPSEQVLAWPGKSRHKGHRKH